MAADLQTMLDDLKAAYYSGASSISYEGKSVQYASRTDMRAAIMSLEKQLGVTGPTFVNVRGGGKGWG